MIYGYARVSTDGQSVDAQVQALKAAGAEKVFKENASGATRDRAQLNKALKALKPGDMLLVSRLDRLGRSSRDILNMVAHITERGAGFRSLADAWADTSSAHGRLMLTILGGLAEYERDLIRSRTSEGMKLARARGVKFGRPSKLTKHQKAEVAARFMAGDSVAAIARSFDISHTVISRLTAPLREEAARQAQNKTAA